MRLLNSCSTDWSFQLFSDPGLQRAIIARAARVRRWSAGVSLSTLVWLFAAGSASAQFFAPAGREAPPRLDAQDLAPSPSIETQDLAPPDEQGTPAQASPAAPKPRVRTVRLPRFGPIPPPRPWGDRDAFTPDPAETASVTSSTPASIAAEPTAAPLAAPAPPETALVDEQRASAEAAQAEPTPRSEATPASRTPPDPAPAEPSAVETHRAATEPPPPPLVAPVEALRIEPPAVARAEPSRPVEAAAEARIAALSAPPAIRPQLSAPAPDREAAPEVGASSLDQAIEEAYSLVLVVRPDVSNVSDLKGRRIALRGVTARDADVSLAVRTAIRGPFIAVPGSRDSDIARLIQGEVDAIVVGFGPALSDEDVKNAAVGSYRALQVPLHLRP